MLTRAKSFAQYWLPVLLGMGLIFYGSTDLLSARHTSRFIRPLVLWLMPSASEATLQRIHGAIRKTGHVFEYAVLAALAWRARRKPAAAPALGWRWPDAAFAWGWAVVFAATDEFHQSFVSTRTGSPIDVLWDSLGATLALGLLWLLHCRLSAR